jgi:hypothetical protein
MTRRSQHGQYDQEKRLPDNSLQPSGAGYTVWLQEQILALFPDGEALIGQSREHGTKRYAWLLERLQARGHVEIVEEYATRKRKADAERRIREKENHRQMIQEQLSQEQPVARRQYLLREMEKIEKYLAARR